MLRISGLLPKELDIAPLLAEAKRQLAQEADYGREGAQMTRFGQLLADDPDVIVPLLNEEFTTKSVLAMSFVEGQPIESLEQRLAQHDAIRTGDRVPTRTSPSKSSR